MNDENIDLNTNQVQNPDEELIRAWVGSKNQDFYMEKFKKGGFNIAAFLIPDLLFITRKMWLEALCIITIDALLIFFQAEISCPIIFLIRAALGIAYYPLYKASIIRKIKTYQNKGISYEEQLEKANKQGGDKITVGVLLMLIVTVTLFTFLGIRVVQTYSDKKSSNNYLYNNSYNEESERIREEKAEKRKEQDEKFNKNEINLTDDWKISYGTYYWEEEKTGNANQILLKGKNVQNRYAIIRVDYTDNSDIINKIRQVDSTLISNRYLDITKPIYENIIGNYLKIIRKYEDSEFETTSSTILPYDNYIRFTWKGKSQNSNWEIQARITDNNIRTVFYGDDNSNTDWDYAKSSIIADYGIMEDNV